MAFPDRETFTAWVMSPEYREIFKDRLAAAETTGILVRGLMCRQTRQTAGYRV